MSEEKKTLTEEEMIREDEERRALVEKQIFEQDLEGVTGGMDQCGSSARYYCSNSERRPFLKCSSAQDGQCAATVEDGSLCNTNDACLVAAVIYYHMENCHRAWD